MKYNFSPRSETRSVNISPIKQPLKYNFSPPSEPLSINISPRNIKLSTNKLKIRTSVSSLSGGTEFYEYFYEYLFKLDPFLEISFDNIHDKSTLMSKLISLIVFNNIKLEDEEYMKEYIKNYSNKGFVYKNYISLCNALLLSIHHIQYTKFTNEIKYSWYCVLSKFLDTIQKYYIKPLF